MGTTPVAGALLPTGINTQIEPAIITDLKSIQDYVGGHIDAVRTEMPDGTIVVGYLHDEGLLIDLPVNWFASALFCRELRGPVVLVSGVSPTGVYDGENYDLPSNLYQFLTTTFTLHVANTYNEAMMMTAALAIGVQEGIFTQDDIRRFEDAMTDATEGGDDSEFRKVCDELSAKIDEAIITIDAKELADEAEAFLKEQGGK